MKTPYKFIGIIKFIEDEFLVKKPNGTKMPKRVFTLQTIDDQLLIIEVRNDNVNYLKNVTINTIVEVKLTFEASEKGEKKYNNLIAQQITLL